MSITKSALTSIIDAASVSGSGDTEESSVYNVADAIAASFELSLGFASDPTTGTVKLEIRSVLDGTNTSSYPTVEALFSPRGAILCQPLVVDCVGLTNLMAIVTNDTDQAATVTLKALKTTI